MMSDYAMITCLDICFLFLNIMHVMVIDDVWICISWYSCRKEEMMIGDRINGWENNHKDNWRKNNQINYLHKHYNN